MPKQSKRYHSATEKSDLSLPHLLDQAIEVLCQMEKAKFDETVELSVALGVDPKQTSHSVRGTVNLPHGSGRKVVVAVFTEKPDEAKSAGADIVGLEDLVSKVKDGWCDFDVAIATPEAMKQVRSVARILGPRGLMPTPKAGTVTDDVNSAVQAVKAGRVEFKMDKTGALAVIVGKRSFSPTQLIENTLEAIKSIAGVRPEGLKGRYIRRMSISSTMSPGISLDNTVFSQL
ncbi:MAG: 50S ribosomal protein L1 [Opitutae bacterium]|nr:50S ribosomal protein L1 [Opitutae bacterium]|tara:strand:- start:2433 stop:3125 length:693 start_codon:yes stop_codon:yes gene_type:complete